MLRSSFKPKRRWRRPLVMLALAVSVVVLSPVSSSAGPATNGRIVFQRVFWDPHGHTRQIALFTVRPDGTDVQRLTDPPAGVETGAPDWSPDGSSIVYVRAAFGEPPAWSHIIVVGADGTGRVDLTEGHCQAPCRAEEDPAWSPDGKRIAFVRVAHEVRGIFVMRADGTHRRRVVVPPSDRFVDSAPAWSPKGGRLVFERLDRRRDAAALFVVRLDDDRTRRITLWTLFGGNRPDWSPDGSWILFQAPIVDGTTELCVIHPDGTGLRSITKSRDFGWSWAGFSPDGTMITAIRVPGENTENDVYVMNADGTGIQAVTDSLPSPAGAPPPAEGLPDWGPAT